MGESGCDDGEEEAADRTDLTRLRRGKRTAGWASGPGPARPYPFRASAQPRRARAQQAL
jgi:hypothetical protein